MFSLTVGKLVTTATPDKESRHWLKVAGAVIGVLLLLVAGALLALKQAPGWHFG
jgi:hypothetical protein